MVGKWKPLAAWMLIVFVVLGGAGAVTASTVDALDAPDTGRLTSPLGSRAAMDVGAEETDDEELIDDSLDGLGAAVQPLQPAQKATDPLKSAVCSLEGETLRRHAEEVSRPFGKEWRAFQAERVAAGLQALARGTDAWNATQRDWDQRTEALKADQDHRYRESMRPLVGACADELPPPRFPLEASLTPHAEARFDVTAGGKNASRSGSSPQGFTVLETDGLLEIAGSRLEMQASTDGIDHVRCAGEALLDAVALPGIEPGAAVDGSLRLLDGLGAPVASLHDDERCTMRFMPTTDLSSFIVEPPGLGCVQDGQTIRCASGNTTLRFLGDAVLLPGGHVEVRGPVTLLRSDAAFAPSGIGEAYEQAVADGRVGAEVRIGPAADGLFASPVSFGDLQVRVEGHPDAVTAVLDAPSGTGRTVSLSIEPGVLEGDDIVIEATAVAADGAETPMLWRTASGLDDVLDPTDDGEAVESWVVQDAEGLHILVSFPHFSEKRITMRPAADASGPGMRDPEVAVPGLGFLATTGLVVAVACLARRR